MRVLIGLARRFYARRKVTAALGQAWRSFEAGAVDEADRVCVALSRDYPDAAAEAHRLHLALAGVFAGDRRHDRAAFHFARALAGLPPGDPARKLTVLQLAAELLALRDDEGAEACYREVLRYDPTDRYAMAHLALCIRHQDAEGARALLKQVVVPGDAGGRLRRALMLPAIPQSLEEIDALRGRFERELDELLEEHFDPVADPEVRVGLMPFYLAFHARNNAPLLAKLGRLCRGIYPAQGGPAPRIDRGARRLRIGFVSMYFYRHSVGRTTLGLVRDLPRGEFETFVFAIEPFADPDAAAYRQYAEHYVALPADLGRVRDAIRAANLDMLLFADIGMHPFTYFLAFWRLAPVQLVTWGHSMTSGIDTLDYYVSAESVETAQSDAYYTEKLLRLPGYFMPRYERAPLPERRSRAELGLPEDAHIYYCPQSLFKLHPDFDALLRSILERDPAAGILLLEGNPRLAPRLRERFARTLGPLAKRVHFVGPMPNEAFLQYLAAADVLLDPLHFGGCNSSCEAFALGQPVVTLPGAQLPGRFTMALYREMEIDDCIAQSIDGYVDIAVRLACEPDFRAAVTRQIAARSGVLFDRADAGVSLGGELLRIAGHSG